ncbi:MAG: 3-dehydroquinate synthase family protein [Formosimonas sp.]
MNDIASEYSFSCGRNSDYLVNYSPNIFSVENEMLKRALGGRKGLAILTPTVYEIYGGMFNEIIKNHDLNMSVMVISCRRENKEFKVFELVEEITNEVIARNLDRKSVLLGIGGGVCTDIVGFSAGIIRRGMPHIRIPTTLLGQIDAGIGLKCGLNHKDKKNFIGLFNPPELSLIDPRFLKTLSPSHYRQGWAEIIKMAVVSDEKLFEMIEQHHDELTCSNFVKPQDIRDKILWRSISLMLKELEDNPFEQNSYKRLVDMGHTFSPRIESESDYQVSHGEAVAIDMALTFVLAEKLGFIKEEVRDRLIHLLDKIGLDVYSPHLNYKSCAAAINDAALHRGGEINFPIPTGFGTVRFVQDRHLFTKQLIEEGCNLLRER